MDTNDLDRLRGELAAAATEAERLRRENAALADQFRAEPSDSTKGDLKRGASSLAAARDHVERLANAVAIFEKTGTPYGIVTSDGKVMGAVALRIPPGASKGDRQRVIDTSLGEPLAVAAEELGVTLSAAPERFTRERPGRDAEGNTVLDVSGRVEGDFLYPAVSSLPKRAT